MYSWKRFFGCVSGCKSTAGDETSALECAVDSPERAPDVICGPMTSLRTYVQDVADSKVTAIVATMAICGEETEDMLRAVLWKTYWLHNVSTNISVDLGPAC